MGFLVKLNDLSPAARARLNDSPEEKIKYIRSDRWLPTPSSRIAFQWGEYLLRGAQSLRPDCAQIIGDSGGGKSATLTAFEGMHPAQRNTDPLRQKRPVMRVEATGEAQGAHSIRQAIMKVAWPHAKQFRLTATELDDTLAAQEIRMLLVDELGEFFTGGPASHRRALAELKRINNLGISLLATTVTSMAHVLSIDPQFANRFTRKITLAPWRETQDLRNFLFGYECEMPFPERSMLDGQERTPEFVTRCEGNTSKIVEEIKLAACWAIERGGSSISTGDFQLARESSTPPPICLRVPV
jgi:hypothetical protein